MHLLLLFAYSASSVFYRFLFNYYKTCMCSYTILQSDTLDGSVAGPSDVTSRGKKRKSGSMLTMKAERRARMLSIAAARKSKKGQSPPPPYTDPSQEL